MKPIIILAAALLAQAAAAAYGQEPQPRQSTTGPVPPSCVEFSKDGSLMPESGSVIDGVPPYSWRHGCGPTAVGMVIGYYDTHSYGDLIAGDASAQSSAVNQAIASQQDTLNRQHYEDYSLPLDSYPVMLADRSALPAGQRHPDNCIADYMHTSWSADGNYYGWSWSNRIGPSFTGFVNSVNPAYAPASATYYMSNGTMSWALLQGEIDNGRPMVFLVDSDGDGGTDHFVTVIGYRDDSGYNEYACWDTWSTAVIRWQRFRAMSSSYTWGVWGGFTCTLGRSVRLQSPNGGEALTGGTVHQIAWSARSYGIDHSRLLLSKDGGLTYNDTIAPTVPGVDTTYDWTVPSQAGGGYRIKAQLIGASGAVIAEDGGDADFSITGSGITDGPVSTPVIAGPLTAACSPNPGKGQFFLRYSLANPRRVTLRLFNACGQAIAAHDLGQQGPGDHSFHFDLRKRGAGMYFYQLDAGELRREGKILVIR